MSISVTASAAPITVSASGTKIDANVTGGVGPQGPAGPPAPSGGPVEWSAITGKPSTFTPATHTHAIADVTGLQTALDAKATPADVTAAVSSVIDAAPAALDTLNELAAALGDDASFASTVTTALSAKAPLASPTFTGTVNGITKSMVGLGNADNTSDANKPISTATQTALDGKANVSHTHTVSSITNAGTAATYNVPASGNAGSSEVVLGSDTRLSDQRVPTDGSVTTAKVADSAVTAVKVADGTLTWAKFASSQIITPLTVTGGVGGVSTTGTITQRAVFGNTTQFNVSTLGVVTVGQWQATAIAVAFGGTGATDAATARTNLGVAYGSTDGTVCQGNDARLSDARTPLSHTHSASAITDFSSAVAAASPEEVVEYLTTASFPATGNASLLYIATDAGRAYRWVGSQYAEIGPTSVSVSGGAHDHDDLYYRETETDAVALVSALIFG